MSDHSTRPPVSSHPEIGDTFGRLTVAGPCVRRPARSQHVTWVPVRCECGVAKDVRLSCLRNGMTRSCGCLSRELTAERSRRPDYPRKRAVAPPARLAIGDRFDRWTVVGEAFDQPKEDGHAAWFVPCRCECGALRPVSLGSLTRGISRSCGCRAREIGAARARHGERGTRLYSIWKGMKQRTGNPNAEAADRYLGRGIRLCPEWEASYEAFRDWALAHGYADGLSIDREDNDGDYEPGNCRWTTAKAQARNTRANTWLTAWGERKVMAEWAEDPRCAVPYRTLARRVAELGWDHERALSAPPGRHAEE